MMFNAVQHAMYRAPAVPIGLNIENLDITRRVMNKLMQRTVEQVRAEPKVYIKERTMIERLFNTAPKQELEAGKPVMYKDRENSWSNTLLCGMDFDFLMLDALVISLINTILY